MYLGASLLLILNESYELEDDVELYHQDVVIRFGHLVTFLYVFFNVVCTLWVLIYYSNKCCHMATEVATKTKSPGQLC